MIGLELRARPIHGGFRHGIKIVRGHQAGDGFVVISANRLRAEFAQARRDFIGIGAVADDVAQANGLIPNGPSRHRGRRRGQWRSSANR